VQKPAAQLGPVTFCGLHAAPHEPQLVSVLRGASHPFALFPSQLPKPETHPPKVHVPVAQLGAVALTGLHATPHAPQFVVV
jgi:hypothetical protein